MERRRVMDERIDKIADDVSYIRGKLDEQAKLKHEDRIKTLENRASYASGFLYAVSLIGGAVGGFLSKYFS